MSSALIYQWLQNNGEYFAGVTLLEQYGNNPVLLPLLKTGEGAYTRKRLIEELQAIAKKMDETQQQAQYNQSFAIAPLPKTDKLPKTIEEKINRRKQTYKQAGEIKASVLYIVDPEERKQAVFNIMALMNENAALWVECNYYEKHGKEKPLKNELVYPELEGLSDKELYRFITNMRSNICRWRKKAEAKPTKKDSYLEKIAEGETQLKNAIEKYNGLV